MSGAPNRLLTITRSCFLSIIQLTREAFLFAQSAAVNKSSLASCDPTRLCNICPTKPTGGILHATAPGNVGAEGSFHIVTSSVTAPYILDIQTDDAQKYRPDWRSLFCIYLLLAILVFFKITAERFFWYCGLATPSKLGMECCSVVVATSNDISFRIGLDSYRWQVRALAVSYVVTK
jgi:hypothetical protein